jgi:uncharacterized membrane protein
MLTRGEGLGARAHPRQWRSRDAAVPGSFLAWAVVDRIALKRRGDPDFGAVSFRNDIIAVVVGTALTVWFIMQLHALAVRRLADLT